MENVYADNSSTSFPKAPGVSAAMKDFLDEVGCNINRGGYASSYNIGLQILQTRELLGEMFGFSEARNVIFTPSVTYSLNMILKGLLKENDHVIATAMEHNAVMRPLYDLRRKGVTYDIIPCDAEGLPDLTQLPSLIKPNTKAVVMIHASNVCGTVMPIYEVAEICRRQGLKLIVDAAQSAGLLEINMDHIDALAFTCHKGLLAAQGLGGFLVKSEMAEELEPIISGGTGSQSHEIAQPGFLPDKFESGTLNIPAILGLKKALEYIRACGPKAILEQELALTARFISAVGGLSGVRLIGKRDLAERLAVVSLDFVGRDNAQIAAILDNEFGVMTRCGLHCAPLAHKTLQTYPQGTVRFSFGHFNTIAEIDYIAASIKDIVSTG